VQKRRDSVSPGGCQWTRTEGGDLPGRKGSPRTHDQGPAGNRKVALDC